MMREHAAVQDHKESFILYYNVYFHYPFSHIIEFGAF